MSNNSKRPNETETLEALLNDTLERDAFLFSYQRRDPEKVKRVEDFFRNYFKKSITYSFVENCKPHILKRTRKMQYDKAKLFLAAAYCAYVATYEVLQHKHKRRELKDIPVAKPNSRYKQDLGFLERDLTLLHSITGTRVETTRFHRIKTVRECFELNFRYFRESYKP